MESKENLLNRDLLNKGFLKIKFPLPDRILPFVKNRNWQELDSFFGQSVLPSGPLFEMLKNYHKFQSIEHMLAIRNAEEDEDGIWHDDGSRYIAFFTLVNSMP